MEHVRNLMDSTLPKLTKRSMFKEEFSLKDRRNESYRIRQKYPDRVPVIVEQTQNNTRLSDIDKKKYLVPRDLTLGQFMYVIRKRIKLPPEQAIFLFIDGMIPASTTMLAVMDDNHRDMDGFLYITYNGENTFGA